MKATVLAVLVVVMLAPVHSLGASANDADRELSGSSARIISKYLQATKAHDALRSASMEVDIDAAVPKLKEHGRLHALRRISKLGKISYRVLGFQGDNTVKTQVIARYLQAEQQGQGDQTLAITPANYRFRLKGQRGIYGRDAFVFQLSPRQKKVGLFKGEIWVDTRTFLPLFEKGRFVKNPTVLFKKIEFERAYSVETGTAVPQYMSSIIDTHLIGRVALDIFYSGFVPNPSEDEAASPAESVNVSLKAVQEP